MLKIEDKIKYLLEYSVNNKIQEIYIEDIDTLKEVIFFDFKNQKLFKDHKDIIKEYDINKKIEIEEVYKKELGNDVLYILKIKKDSTEILENLHIKLYYFQNKNKNSVYIKLLNYSIPLFQKTLANFKENNIDKKILYNYLINPNISGINIISSHSNNAIKLFIYSIIKEINNSTSSKILSYENIIEKTINSKKSIVLQKELNNDILNEIKILNPDIILIEEELNDEILYWAYKLSSWNKKVIITTSITESKILTNQIEQICNKYNILQTNYNENTLGYFNLKYKDSLEIDHIFLSDDLY